MVFLDTTVLIDALRRRSDRREELAEMLVKGIELATSVVNVAEVYAGMRSGEEARTEAFLFGTELLPVTEAIAHHAGGWKQREPVQSGRTRWQICRLQGRRWGEGLGDGR